MSDTIVDLPLEDHPITEYFAFVLFGSDGREAIPSIDLSSNIYPMMCNDRTTIELMRPRAKRLAEKTGYGLKLVRFGSIEVVETIIHQR